MHERVRVCVASRLRASLCVRASSIVCLALRSLAGVARRQPISRLSAACCDHVTSKRPFVLCLSNASYAILVLLAARSSSSAV